MANPGSEAGSAVDKAFLACSRLLIQPSNPQSPLGLHMDVTPCDKALTELALLLSHHIPWSQHLWIKWEAPSHYCDQLSSGLLVGHSTSLTLKISCFNCLSCSCSQCLP